MNERLATIERIARVFHQDRPWRFSDHNGYTNPCPRCLDVAQFVYDEVLPAIKEGVDT